MTDQRTNHFCFDSNEFVALQLYEARETRLTHTVGNIVSKFDWYGIYNTVIPLSLLKYDFRLDENVSRAVGQNSLTPQETTT